MRRMLAAALGLGSLLGAGCGGRAALQRPADYDTMVLVPAGPFTRGRDGSVADEGPARTLHLDAFAIDRNEVTNADFKAFCDATGRLAPTNPMWDENYFFGQPTHPVVNINYEQATAYCAWKGKRLPTEAEWEKAARGTDGRLYPWGNEWDAARANLKGEPFERTSPVGSLPAGASPYGVLDMAGNVWEWCSDWFDEGYYAIAPERNPAGPAAATPWRAVRGGGNSSPQSDAEVTNRSKAPPSQGIHHLGCRCAWSEKPPVPDAPKQP